jgi:hypothetical protein
MGRVVIGMDPHKRSATIEVIDEREQVLARGRYATEVDGYRQMLAAGASRQPHPPPPAGTDPGRSQELPHPRPGQLPAAHRPHASGHRRPDASGDRKRRGAGRCLPSAATPHCESPGCAPVRRPGRRSHGTSRRPRRFPTAPTRLPTGPGRNTPKPIDRWTLRRRPDLRPAAKFLSPRRPASNVRPDPARDTDLVTKVDDASRVSVLRFDADLVLHGPVDDLPLPRGQLDRVQAWAVAARNHDPYRDREPGLPQLDAG